MDNPVRVVTDWLQIVNLLMAGAILLLSLTAGQRWKTARPYLLGPITFAAHSIVFYLAALGGWLPQGSTWVSLWSALLRMHSYAFILGTLAAFYLVALSPQWDGRGDGYDEL